MEIIELNGLFVNNFISYNDKDTVLIDTGFLNGTRTIKKALKKIGRGFNDVNHILLTHGHFDHAVHLKKLKKLTNAPVYCSIEEQIHIDGKYPYKGINRITGVLEALGRFAFQYQSLRIDIHINDGDVIDIFGGIQTVFLPGHSIGHLGYLHQPSKVLFVGDFIDTRRRKERFPPAIFNTFPERFPESIQKVDTMDLNGIISNHGPSLSAEKQLLRFKKFTKKHYIKKS
jgi:glyoxylase-like metal-dependent hydrolase (beta-lactamase superfamily II)